LDGNNWARASVVNKYNMRWGESTNPKAIELEAFLIDWGYSERINNIVSNVRLIPESSNFLVQLFSTCGTHALALKGWEPLL